jgi:hypothetical protein
VLIFSVLQLKTLQQTDTDSVISFKQGKTSDRVYHLEWAGTFGFVTCQFEHWWEQSFPSVVFQEELNANRELYSGRIHEHVQEV